MPEAVAPTRPVAFGERLSASFERFGQLCLGIDPHASLLHAWGLEDSATGAREFGLRAVEAATGLVGVVKPQAAFFERHGAAGLAALEEIIAAGRAAGILVLSDVKRGDIGSTMDAYADAWLRVGSPLESDAITVSPYLGVGALDGTVELARAGGKGVFVLAATSNPAARTIQAGTVPDGHGTIAAGVVAAAAEAAGSAPLGPVGVVIGATVRLVEFGLRPAALERVPILAPGFGEQGAAFADVRSIFGSSAGNVIMSSSRQLLAAGPDGLADAIRRTGEGLRA